MKYPRLDATDNTGRIPIGGELDSLSMRKPPMGAECIVYIRECDR
jgi:hypothetical protein